MPVVDAETNGMKKSAFVLVAVVATFVAFVAVVAVVAVAALPPIDKLAAVPVNPVPGPSNCVVAVTVVPRTVAAVVAPTVAPSIAPPVMATELAFWVDIVPRPLTCVFEMAIAVVAAAVSWPCALTENVATELEEP